MQTLFTRYTTAIIYGRKVVSIQRMLDFDFLCNRKPSVAAVVDPQSSAPEKVFFGSQEIILPVFRTLAEANSAHSSADVLINFASLRSAGAVVDEGIELGYRVIATIAEGVPERDTRRWIAKAQQKGTTLIGPATVGAVTAGAFRIGDAGGSNEHLLASKLYRPGCIGYVGKSGGMSNEMYRLISENSSGIVEGIAIGGDRFGGSNLLEHLRRFENNPDIKILCILSEVGGTEEADIAKALQDGTITKPLIAWVAGTSADSFPKDVQFGHAGAWAASEAETAAAKNTVLRNAGAHVPSSFEQLGATIQELYVSLKLPIMLEPDVPEIPKVRTPTHFQCTISDDRGDEATYGDKPISHYMNNGSLLEVIAQLWWKVELPPEILRYLEMILSGTADHGPCVAGAHNAIVAATAGKDVISSLCSGLLTIGPRFGGAVDGAAHTFASAYKAGKSPLELIEDMKKQGKRIPGIGHKIKTIHHPDMRVRALLDYAHANFAELPLTQYALEVEKITTSKKPSLILNVDGTIAVTLLDILVPRLPADVQETFFDAGYLNGLFSLGRSIGILGHIFDQKRLGTPLYRHPQEDVLYGDGSL